MSDLCKQIKEDHGKEVPEQLTELLNSLSSELFEPEKDLVDIFLQNEFDIGTFQEVKHGIAWH